MKKLPEFIQGRAGRYYRLMRLDKPIGILLLLWPTLWGLWIAAEGRPDWTIVGVFVAGTVLMRSAGCVMNDYADRKFDSRVARTRARPLVTGEVQPNEALWLTFVLVATAFILVLSLNRLTVLLSIPALFLAASYPYTKRFFPLPQAYLGIAFGFGIPMAFAAQTGEVHPVAWWLLLANVFWALAYDTEYAMVDREDDVKIGIHSSALLFGRYDVAMVMTCYVAMLVILVWVGSLASLGWPYQAGLAVAAGLALYHLLLIRHREPVACFRAFLHNNWLGATVFCGVLLGSLS